MKKNITLVSCVVILTVGFTIWKFPAIGQKVISDKENVKEQLLDRINQSPDIQLRIVENDDSPLRISEAKVKVISGEDYTKLTGKATDLKSLSSIPTFRVINVSDKVITGFMLMFRDPVRSSSRIIGFDKLKVNPGESYSMVRDDMVSSKVTTLADDLGVRQNVSSKMEVENYWIATGNHSDSFFTVGKVTFADGSTWTIKEEGEVR